MVEINCPLQIIKELSTLDKNFVTEAVLEKCLQTVQVLVVETELIQFLWQLFNFTYYNNVLSAIG